MPMVFAAVCQAMSGSLLESSGLAVSRGDGLREALHLHRGAVGKNFGYALHHFGCVVAHGYDGIGSMLRGMLQQQLIRIFAGFLAEIGQNRYVAANDGLQRSAQISDYAARPDDDSAYDAVVLNDAVAGKFVGGRNHGTIHAIHSDSPG